jgi:histone H3/H4
MGIENKPLKGSKEDTDHSPDREDSDAGMEHVDMDEDEDKKVVEEEKKKKESSTLQVPSSTTSSSSSQQDRPRSVSPSPPVKGRVSPQPPARAPIKPSSMVALAVAKRSGAPNGSSKRHHQKGSKKMCEYTDAKNPLYVKRTEVARLMKRAGSKKHSCDARTLNQRLILVLARRLMKNAVIYSEYSGRKTIRGCDIQEAARMGMDVRLYATEQ